LAPASETFPKGFVQGSKAVK
jgi:hypothetical protein